MAYFCLATGVQPSEWKALTRHERDAFRDMSHVIADEQRNP